MRWKPLLKNQITEKLKCEEIINNISEKLMSKEKKEFLNIGLTGYSGELLFFCYLYKSNKSRNKDKLVIIQDIILDCLKKIENENVEISFVNGLAGFVWTLKHISKILINESDFFKIPNEFYTQINEHIFRWAILNIDINNLDYLYGALGVGVYLNECPTYFNDKRIEIIESIYNVGIYDEEFDQLKWHSNFIKLFPEENEEFEFNLSIAHGNPSILIVLTNLIKKLDRKLIDKYSHMLISTQNWILQTKNIKNSYSLFPNSVKKDYSSKKSRLAWCYGDLGVLWSLLISSKLTSNDHLKSKCLENILFSIKRKEKSETGIVDDCICHGSAGVAHFLARFNAEYDNLNEELSKNTIFWYRKIISNYNKLDNCLGYNFYHHTDGFTENFNLLEGITGIGLVLLSAISDDEPKWDRCLLLS